MIGSTIHSRERLKIFWKRACRSSYLKAVGHFFVMLKLRPALLHCSYFFGYYFPNWFMFVVLSRSFVFIEATSGLNIWKGFQLQYRIQYSFSLKLKRRQRYFNFFCTAGFEASFDNTCSISSGNNRKKSTKNYIFSNYTCSASWAITLSIYIPAYIINDCCKYMAWATTFLYHFLVGQLLATGIWSLKG